LGKLGVVLLAWSLRKGMKMRKKLVGEAPPQGRRGGQGGAARRRRSPAELRRGRFSMAMEEGKLLHGLVGEREVWGEWEREQGVLW